jgi:4'-phosphopantetheinyl transferase
MGYPAPAAGDVHLWRAPLDISPGAAGELAQGLSSEELRRAGSFRREVDRTRFAVGRGWLRRLLGSYLDADASELALSQDAGGKPRLVHPQAQRLRFNLSHSEGLVVFAVALNREVGVDIEQVRLDFPIDGVAGRVFSWRERKALYALPPHRRADAFFALWTEKEAYLKCVGVGWGDRSGRESLDSLPWFDSFAPKGLGRGAATQVSLGSFYAGAGYAAALAVEGGRARIPTEASLVRLTLP